MAELIKKNEAVVLPTFKNGVTLQFMQITFPSTVAALLTATTAGVPSPVAKALEAVQSRVTVEVIGTLQTSGTVLPIAVAAIGGTYPTDNYDGASGTETLVSYLNTLVQAVTYAGSATIQGIAMGSVTVTAGWPALTANLAY